MSTAEAQARGHAHHRARMRVAGARVPLSRSVRLCTALYGVSLFAYGSICLHIFAALYVASRAFWGLSVGFSLFELCDYTMHQNPCQGVSVNVFLIYIHKLRKHLQTLPLTRIPIHGMC